jgi:hypothetical protein
MISQSVTKKLVLYRCWMVALINAVITWITLIIAPLGLFAVILCTLGVFISSLVVGWMCDRALIRLINQNYRDVMSARRESESIDFAYPDDLNLSAQPQKNNVDD